MVVLWDGLHHVKTALDPWTGLSCFVTKILYDGRTMDNHNILSCASLRMRTLNRTLTPKLDVFSKGSLTMLSL